MSSLKQHIAKLFSGFFTPRPTAKLTDWAKKNIWLSTKESGDLPGYYDPELNPLPTILFEAFESGEYHRAVFKKSSQSGVTLAVLILICYYVTYIARNFIYVIDSKDEMRRISKERLQPMLKSCKAVQGKIAEADDLTNLTLSFKGLTGYLCGSNSLGPLANKSVGLGINDETDTYQEKKAVGLTADRGKKQSSFFHILLSKPENWGDTINQEYLIGTRHHPFYPCPHCQTMQEVEWSRVKYSHCKDMLGDWDFKRMKKEIFLECISESCRESHPEGISESWKPWMLQRLEWRATNLGQDEHKPLPGVFSCKIDDLMSTFPTTSWAVLVAEWLEAITSGDVDKIKKFKQGRLAEAWRPKEITVEDKLIYRMTERYLRGHCPIQPWVVLMAVDRQQVVRKWVKTAWTQNGDCYVVDWGECLSDADLLREADTPVIVDQWDEITPEENRVNPTVYKFLCDEGFEQKEVRDFVVSTFIQWLQNDKGEMYPDYRAYSCWGQGGMHSRNLRDFVVPTIGDRPNAHHNGYPIYAYRFSDDAFKDDLYNQRINRFKEIETAIREGSELPKIRRLYFPGNLDADFVDELCQERFTWDEARKKWSWEEPKGKNDFGDGLKMNFVGWYIIQPMAALNMK